MPGPRPLPEYLAQRYRGWRATTFAENLGWYRRLAEDGQRPRVMVISCCDSRVHVTSIFGAEQGEFFIHRNIAALVPPCRPDGDQHGTSAAIEYAVEGLGVTNLIVMGHSGCGGVRACHDMCAGTAAPFGAGFVQSWMEILRPGYERVADIPGEAERLRALEYEAVTVSLANLATFPFVAARVADGTLALHGAWTDIGEGGLAILHPEAPGRPAGFVPL